MISSVRLKITLVIYLFIYLSIYLFIKFIYLFIFSKPLLQIYVDFYTFKDVTQPLAVEMYMITGLLHVQNAFPQHNF